MSIEMWLMGLLILLAAIEAAFLFKGEALVEWVANRWDGSVFSSARFRSIRWRFHGRSPMGGRLGSHRSSTVLPPHSRPRDHWSHGEPSWN